MTDAGARGRYLYCVLRSGDPPSLEGLSGVDSSSTIEVIGDESLAAVKTSVPLEEFGAEALRRNLEDMDWLERTARSHQDVLDSVLGQVEAMVPMRLCTIFDDDRQVLAMLERERDVLVAALDRVQGHSEWSVKLLADTAAVEAAARDRIDTAAQQASTGRAGHAYLERKRQERSLQERSRDLVEEAAQEVHSCLGEQARAATLLPPQRREVSGRSGDMVLNAAYLVDRSRVSAFRATVEELRTRHEGLGLVLELGGPWAPYNFVAAEQPA
jgi:hypothetical protein